jgi:hypothetical protein
METFDFQTIGISFITVFLLTLIACTGPSWMRAIGERKKKK